MLITDLKKSSRWKQLPDFIKTDAIFNRINHIKKPFVKYGLKNNLEPINELIDGKKSYIGFSSYGISGFWDIATMSMRGVCSCMHWKNAHSSHLIGSLTDTFLGIIYLSDNEMTPYGISFRRRALVRFGSNMVDRACLVVDRVYKDSGNKNPEVYNNRDLYARDIDLIFRNYLENKTSIPVYSPFKQSAHSIGLFYSDSFRNLNESRRSLVDAGHYPRYNEETRPEMAEFISQI